MVLVGEFPFVDWYVFGDGVAWRSASFVERDSQEVSVRLFCFTDRWFRSAEQVFPEVYPESRLRTAVEVVVSGIRYEDLPILYGYEFVAVRVLLTLHDFLGCS